METKTDCVPFKEKTPVLKGAALRTPLFQLEDWEVVDEHHLVKTYKFPDFKQALAFVNRVGEIAECANHHPDIDLTWGKVTLKIWDHKLDGLTENDFILAAEIDQSNAC